MITNGGKGGLDKQNGDARSNKGVKKIYKWTVWVKGQTKLNKGETKYIKENNKPNQIKYTLLSLDSSSAGNPQTNQPLINSLEKVVFLNIYHQYMQGKTLVQFKNSVLLSQLPLSKF